MEINSIETLVKVLSQMFPHEASIVVGDRKKYIYYQPSKNIDLRINSGDLIPEGSISYEALRYKQRIAKYVDSDVFGMPYYAMAIPLVENGQEVGVITAIFPPLPGIETQKLPQHHFLIGKGDDKWIPIPLQNVYFIKSENGKTLLYTDIGVYQNKYTLTELERFLPHDQFIRCHRAYIINTYAVTEIHPDFHSTFILVMKDDNRSRVPVSQKYASVFRKLLGF
ncbi:LytTR family DNA-binding domain-containing protein [Massilibacterium senegalense]|uniref:LytTR family DNA-binding domain-containing protein n=1 Tax=Massilibacterium senegalense TaxID=1632858 RepID=UPI0007828040|nr:LytTR family DNA-binding domain-containing protein [Massilibacterium senegalense]